MRRHPVVRRPRPSHGGLFLVVLMAVAACGTVMATKPTVDVMITSASGESLGFEPAETTIRVGNPTTITFLNRSTLQHNLVFTAGIALATRTIVEPGTSDHLLAPASPGVYPFSCTIHEGMTGTLIVLE